jgi:hypothetical protein
MHVTICEIIHLPSANCATKINIFLRCYNFTQYVYKSFVKFYNISISKGKVVIIRFYRRKIRSR